MVCNNLAARGLDTMNAKHVIQLDYAKNPIDYVHRIGRVGRLG
jgi:superfamily II DNA/RNA helicase